MTLTSRYEKKSGSRITAKLGYSFKGSNYWGGQFTQSKGQVKQKKWSRTAWNTKCNSTIGMLWVKGQGTFQTPPGTC
ncbi:hypothetical protein [Streptomyces apocyni]|uniref:hypothetical protein n=1 Tax=Streptomyces apocyni TaxID=2654677 RepID=UPI001E5BCA0B|nr:hypothetical protein [Streptomyces apocyni]